MRRQFPSRRRILAALAFIALLAPTSAPVGHRMPSAVGLESFRLPLLLTGRTDAAPMPALQGKEATQYLKQHGSYASLEEAIAATRYRVVRASQKNSKSVTESSAAYE